MTAGTPDIKTFFETLDECIDCKLNFMVKPEGILIESWLESIPAYYLGVEFRNFLNDPKNH